MQARVAPHFDENRIDTSVSNRHIRLLQRLKFMLGLRLFLAIYAQDPLMLPLLDICVFDLSGLWVPGCMSWWCDIFEQCL